MSMENYINGFHISNLKKNVGDYSRPYQFYCYLDLPTNLTVNISNTLPSYLVKSATLPQSSIPVIKTEYQGQSYKFGGTHDFASWTCTYYCDKDDLIRSLFVEWMQLIHNPSTNVQNNPKNYFGNIKIQHLSGAGKIIMEYELKGAFPTSVAEASLDYGSRNAVSEFGVTFEYQYFTVCQAKNGTVNSSDSITCGDSVSFKN